MIRTHHKVPGRLLLRVGALFALGIGPWIWLSAQRSREPPLPAEVGPAWWFDPAHSPVDAAIRRHIDELRKESLRESLAKLDLVEMYFWPGCPEVDLIIPEFPVPPRHWMWDIHTVMSNRRFLKVYQELAALPKAEANTRVSRQLRQTFRDYQVVLDRDLGLWKDLLDPKRDPDTGLGYPLVDLAGTKSTMGCRLKVFALMILAANLELRDTHPIIREICSEARQQYKAFSNKQKFHYMTAFCVVIHMSLYNPQILGGALIATSKPQSRIKLPWELERLTRFDAPATSYDLHGRLGAVPVDLDDAGIAVRYVKSLSDQKFMVILDSMSKGQ